MSPVYEKVRDATKLRCSTCRLWKYDEQFSTDSRNPRRRGRRGICRTCDSAAKAAKTARLRAAGVAPPPPHRKSSAELRAFWLERFTLGEIREMAAALELTLGRTP